ncbi:MAG: hypothetical protein HQK51_09550, partial [Oligoflexia bacterium]|nr:hypothetical protein [Oligoflexia bacterium]
DDLIKESVQLCSTVELQIANPWVQTYLLNVFYYYQLPTYTKNFLWPKIQNPKLVIEGTDRKINVNNNYYTFNTSYNKFTTATTDSKHLKKPCVIKEHFYSYENVYKISRYVSNGNYGLLQND